MNIEQLGKKLEKLGKDLMPSKDAAREGATPFDREKGSLAGIDSRGAADAVAKPDLVTEGKPEVVDARLDPCLKLDILADNRPEVADKGATLSPDSRIDSCSKLDITARYRERIPQEDKEYHQLAQPMVEPIVFTGDNQRIKAELNKKLDNLARKYNSAAQSYENMVQYNQSVDWGWSSYTQTAINDKKWAMNSIKEEMESIKRRLRRL